MTLIVRGDRGRIGFLLPADGLTDDEYWSCLPDGVALLAARYLVAGGLSLEELESDTDIGPILDAVELIRQARADVAALADCAGAVVGGLDYERDLVERVEGKLGRPATSTPRAIAASLRALGARRIVLAAPYLDVVVEKFAEFLAGFGIETVGSKAIAYAAETEIAELGPEQWRAVAREVDRPGADAVVLGGGGIRAAAALDGTEGDLGKPVVAAPRRAHLAREPARGSRCDPLGPGAPVRRVRYGVARNRGRRDGPPAVMATFAAESDDSDSFVR